MKPTKKSKKLRPLSVEGPDDKEKSADAVSVTDSIRPYRIFGIYDTVDDELLSVNMDYDNIEMEYEMMDLSDNRYEIVEFTVVLT